MLPEPIGVRIARFRNARGLTQADLAARMQTRGHSTMYDTRVNEIEQGRRVVRPDELVSFARVLGIPITTLLGVPDFSTE
jgi:transcriptional regulator with XRE-family HTH domain